MNCMTCKSETANPRFCSRSCAAIYNNSAGIANRRKPEGACRSCGTPVITRKTWCKKCLSDCPPRKSRTSPSNLEDSSQVPPVRGCCTCGTIITHASIYCKSCSATISAQRKADDKIKLWLSGKWRGGSDRRLSDTVRRYMISCANNSCSKCGFSTTHPVDGASILEINHIDGNGLNHSPDNLEVLCPNCHALTDSYRGRNIGNGRPVYYIRKCH
jgi:5-methylcytosine-specific restriction endonuclease McrA